MAPTGAEPRTSLDPLSAWGSGNAWVVGPSLTDSRLHCLAGTSDICALDASSISDWGTEEGAPLASRPRAIRRPCEHSASKGRAHDPEARGGATGVIPEAIDGRQLYSWIGVAKRSKSSSIPDMGRVTQTFGDFAPESVMCLPSLTKKTLVGKCMLVIHVN